ncbi:MAG: hypothetical protein EAZ70_10375 [Runella slithyformis]|nr:MAG: hypothetical protein EAY79_11020 [Runella slithyformis]TAF93250.1 MAG: hypothetical protein EAZ46_12585 [Runella sp.]TAG23891.1 MAG: hypothetical protein EAZ38_02355 [Cytophagales bacterium]TAG34413.1 MAG: hypothetical protein EAZ32_19695 [Cytophagia bacterium]TAF25335.1 MAG: hypothetical protein EAZ70_10375 [Runella slithyformis]
MKTITDFKDSLVLTEPPSLPPLLLALWHDAKGNWNAAHEIAQTQEGTAAYDRLHAYLHRKEGDSFNADYWYRHAHVERPVVSLPEEWELLAEAFLMLWV